MASQEHISADEEQHQAPVAILYHQTVSLSSQSEDTLCSRTDNGKPDMDDRSKSPVLVPNRTVSTFARLRGNTPRAPFTHPLADEKTTATALVDFEGPDDPYRPLNWSARKKRMTLIIYALTATGAAFNSAIFATAGTQVSKAFHVSDIVTSLAVTLMLLGFALGPLLWGPLSEVYGRKWTVLIPYFLSAFFTFGCGAAANIQTILITRFFQGLFSGGVITNTGGVLGDIYSAKERGPALVIYSMSVVGGPLLSPIVGSAIVDSYLRWRWTMYIVGIYQLTISTIAMLLVTESYAPVLLVQKARALRFSTGNYSLHAAHEEWNVSLVQLGTKYLVRPFQLLVTPICFLMSFYASFVYGLLYGSLSAIPIVFGEHRGWSPIVASLPFLALLIGSIIGLVGNMANQGPYGRAMEANGGRPVPEARLFPMMIGGFCLAAGLFIFAWTGTLDVVWVVPCIGLVLIGAGFFPIFQASLNYIVDTFLSSAASAVATVTFMRSALAAAFPIFMAPMLHAMGIGWGLSVFGFIAVGMIPIPFFFYLFGKRIRARGKWSKGSV